MQTNANSIKAFNKEKPKMPTQKIHLLSLIAKANYPVTREMLEKWTGWKHNVITARLNELENEEVKIHSNNSSISQITGHEITAYDTFKTPEDRIEAIYKKRKEAQSKLDDLVSDYQEGNVHGHTLEMVKSEKNRLEKYIKKLDRL